MQKNLNESYYKETQQILTFENLIEIMRCLAFCMKNYPNYYQNSWQLIFCQLIKCFSSTCIFC